MLLLLLDVLENNNAKTDSVTNGLTENKLGGLVVLITFVEKVLPVKQHQP